MAKINPLTICCAGIAVPSITAIRDKSGSNRGEHGPGEICHNSTEEHPSAARELM